MLWTELYLISILNQKSFAQLQENLRNQFLEGRNFVDEDLLHKPRTFSEMRKINLSKLSRIIPFMLIYIR